MQNALAKKLKQNPLAADFLALLAGCCYPLALAPFDLWIAGIISVVLLLVAIDESSIRRGAIRFYLFGIGCYGVGASWIYVSIHEHGQASVLLAGMLVSLFVLGVALPMLLQGYVYQRFFRQGQVGLLLGFTALWTLKEWFYTWFLTGFPWLFAGYAHLDTPLAGYAQFLGVLGVGFCVLLSAVLVYVGFTVKTFRIFSLLILSLVWLVGFALSKVEFVSVVGDPVPVSVVQGNIDQRVKWQRNMVTPIVRTYVGLSREEWDRNIIVWPEAAITVFRESASELLDDLSKTAREQGSTLILGLPDRNVDGEFLNAAIAIGNGNGEYFKRRLVPFGEYVPLESLLRGIIHFFDLPMSHNQTGAWEQPLLKAGDLKVAISICYEVAYPDLVRSNQESPDLLVTISNDSWFGESIGPLQHMQMARMRALENSRYMIRSTNNGVTAVIDHHGKVAARLPQFESGVLRADVRKLSGTTPFNRIGQGPILVLIVSLLLGQLIWRHQEIR